MLPLGGAELSPSRIIPVIDRRFADAVHDIGPGLPVTSLAQRPAIYRRLVAVQVQSYHTAMKRITVIAKQ